MYTRKELAQMYTVSITKIKRLLRDSGITHNKLITPMEFDLFQQKIGKPRAHK